MPNKEQFEKKAWEWAVDVEPDEVTDDHIETVYRVKLKPCSLTTCRKNCKGNPHCLSGLGTKSWTQTLNYDNSQGIADPNLDKRQSLFVGLKNLGATCYVNSFLQVWYHNPAFRKAIYQWKSEESEGCEEIAGIYNTVDPDVTEGALSTNPSGSNSAYIHQLQLVFALLQFSDRKYIDPSPFINSLGLNTNQQQDAQEFCKLFTANLEAKLLHQTNPSVKHIVQELYCGEYSYVTRCNHCSSESSQQSRFYELDLNIKGHRDLYECLEEFLKEENLVGLNQYFCDNCQCKKDAVRLIQLVHLPPFLNLQLLRFMFDRQTRRKKKLNSTVHFPEILDMSKYVCRNPGSVVYDLCAVLIHVGQSAYSGHYVAHIKDRVTGSWYKFNDENVEKMENNKLQLGSEEASTSYENNGPKQQKTPKLQKGQHGSNCAYMLVYKLRKENEKEHPPDSSLDDWDIPEFLQNAVAEDNSQFDEWVKEMNEMRESNMAFAIARQKEINMVFSMLPATEEQEYEFLSTDWIVKWLNSDHQPLGTEEIPKVDHQNFLCCHKKLNPDNVCKVKCVSTEAADLIFEKYGGGPRLRNALCRECVARRCEAICLKNRLQADQKLLSNFMKYKIDDSEEAYWVGKLSLRNWRKLALQKYQDLNDIKNDTVCDGNVSSEEQTCNTLERCNLGDNGNNSCGNNHKSTDEDQENEMLQFNEDICCEHNCLNADENSRKLVVLFVWDMLKTHFPKAPVFPRNAEVCLICMQQVAANKKIRSDLCTLAGEQRLRLSDLYRDRYRPNYYKVDHGSILYIVGKYFVDDWRRFVRDPQRAEQVTDLMNSQLLCVHGLLLYSPQLTDDVDPKSCLVLVSQDEWEVIKRLFIVDHEISVAIIKDDGKEPCIVSHPSVCEDCYAARMKEEAEQELQFSNAKIYVRRVSKCDEIDGGGELVVVFETPVTNNKAETACTLEEDPDFVQTVKKQKTEDGVGNYIPFDTHLRRSTRKSTRRTRSLGEKEIIISSTTTLMELKVQIMNIFVVGVYDQHLFLNGKKLTNNDATMASLNVLPYSQILLKVDEARDFSEDYIKGGGPETGFEGTELMRN